MASPRDFPTAFAAGPEDDLLRPTECRAPIRLVGYTADRVTGELSPAVAVAARCRSWRDPGCGLRLRLLHTDFIRAGVGWHAERGSIARLVTITFPLDEGAQVDRAKDVSRCSELVTKFIQEIRRSHAPRLEYYAAKESTKRGRLHIHLVTTGPYLRKCRHRPDDPKRDPDGVWINPCHGPHGCAARSRPCIQAIAHRLGLGFVDLRRVASGAAAAGYVAKYLNKQIGLEWPRYSRRASYSLGRLRCDTHPDAAGSRCCTEAHRTTGYYPPQTIGSLWRRASHQALIRGYLDGHITLDDLDRHDNVARWEYGGRAEPPRAPPNNQLSERDLIRRVNRITDAKIRAAGLNPQAWRHAEAIAYYLRGEPLDTARQRIPEAPSTTQG